MKKSIYLIIIVFIASSFSLMAQRSSSYSRFGIGDLEYSYSSRKLGMGLLGVAVADKNHISNVNPASYNKLARTRIEFNLAYNGVFLSGDNESSYFAETDFRGFTFGFPVSEDYGIGVAMGIIPYSRISYAAIQEFESPDPSVGSYDITYEGKGGLSSIFLGTSYRLPFDFSIGATLDYYFGNLNYFSKINFDGNSGIPAEYERSVRPTGFGSTVGFISPNLSTLFAEDSLLDIRLGGSMVFISNLNTDTLLTSRSSVLVDTVANGNTLMEVPLRISGGLTVQFASQYLLTFDYTFQPWTEFKLGAKKGDNLQDSYKISAGFEYTPMQELGQTFWEQIVWRAGLSFERTPYIFNGTGIDQYSVAGGFSLPISRENLLDFGVQYSLRGTNDQNLIKENFIKLSLGISFGELWFLRFEK